MPVLYDTSGIREQLAQPQTIRVRHPYRGPRSSYRINLEISQLSYDILRLYKRVNGILEDVAEHRDMLIEGGEPVDGTEIDGFEELIDRVARLRDRVRHLEA